MKNKLVYKFVRTLDETSFSSDVNFLCKDNYVHIRLKRFGYKKEHISGFESKLTFLLTLMMINAVNEHITTVQAKLSQDKENYKELWESCLNCLKSSKEFKDLDWFLCTMFESYKGLKILPMYSLKYKPKNAYDLLGDCYGLSQLSIERLLRVELKDDLYGFLFDNSLEIYIEESHDVDDSKFIKKHLINRTNKKETYINLWDVEVR